MKHSQCKFSFAHSRFLYQLYETNGLPSLRDKDNGCKWLCKISQETGVTLHFSISLLKRIYKQCSKVVTNVERLKKNGRQKQCYLDKDWQLAITPSDVKDKLQTAEVCNIYTVQPKFSNKKFFEDFMDFLKSLP